MLLFCDILRNTTSMNEQRICSYTKYLIEGFDMAHTPKGPIYVYSKQIKEPEIKSNIRKRTAEKENLVSVIGSLMEIGKSRPFAQLEFGDNCTDWINDVLEDFSNDNTQKEKSLKFLLNDFSDKMMTRMRETDKYAIALVSKKFLLLCHATMGERTITPLWDVVDRMLDKDNVERFVIFKKTNDLITVTYYEHSPSGFFVNWLGLSSKDAFTYLGGRNRISSAIDGIHYSFELTDEQIENQILKDTGIFTRGNDQLILKTPISIIDIKQIRVGKKYYAHVSDFLQDYLARKNDLEYYRDEYEKISKSLAPLISTYLDDIDGLVKVTNEGEELKIRKRNPHFNILFSGTTKTSGIIDFRESYFMKLFSDYINGVHINIFHAGMKMHKLETGSKRIGPMEIFNEIQCPESIDRIIEFDKNTEIKDKILKTSLQYSIFQLLSQSNYDKPISLFFSKFAQSLGNTIKIPTTVIENEADVIELKSRDFLVGKDDAIVDRIADDINKKVKEDPFKIYLFGIDEKTNKIEPISSQKFNSGRIGGLEKKLIKTCNNIRLSLVKIPLNQGEDCLFFMPVLLDENT
jgi:hypothetical protein